MKWSYEPYGEDDRFYKLTHIYIHTYIYTLIRAMAIITIPDA